MKVPLNPKNWFRRMGDGQASARAESALGNTERAERDWRIIGASFLLAAAALSLQGFWSYGKINRGEFVVPESDTSPVSSEILADEIIDEAISEFEEKEKLFEKVEGGEFDAVDPAR